MMIIDSLLGSIELKKMVKRLVDAYNSSDSIQAETELTYIEKLLVIFRQKDEGTIRAITQNIDTFLKVPTAAEEPAKKKKGA